jgi:nucleotidyltransferase AbiEii toxin of type IV toxin-antitoxin system
MIPRDYITSWRANVPWVQDFQVEQDLVISRALVEIYSKRDLSAALAFRGGTALHKLHMKPPARYSEDIDLVQVRAGAIGPTLTALRGVLDSWLDEPQWKQNEGRVTLNYRFDSEDAPPLASAESRDQFPRAFHGVRIEEHTVHRGLPVVPGLRKDCDV